MSKEQLLSNKAKLEKGLTNKNLTDAQKELAKKRLEEIEAKLADLEEDSKEPESTEPEAATPEAGQQRRSEPATNSDKPKAKKKPKEHKEAFKSDCNETLAKVRALIGEHNAKKPAKKSKPATVKRASQILSDGISSVIIRSIKKELTLDKVGKIKLPKLREARDKFAEALKAMRIALGGISNDNDQFIQDFTADVNKIFDEVEERQKKADTKQAA